jgi:cellulose synthase (UDP-forming)
VVFTSRLAREQHFWKFRESPGIGTGQKFILGVLVAGGIYSMLYFADWWFRPEHVGNIVFFILLTAFFWYGFARLLLTWIAYLHIRKPAGVPPPPGMRVAIFTTSSPGEPLSMFEKTLEACKNITYPHVTYLLDDTRDPAFRAVAEKHGAKWLELVGIPGAKAGKINRALQLTDEDFILVLDPDHIPFPEFLDHTLGYFQDEKVGFVQVSQAYYNQYRSFTAAAAAEQTYTFYGPTQMALHGLGSAVAIGANCTFRRKALESIDGHGIGLAEDLITSIRLHAAGWKSIYNPVVVSRGLVPEDFGSFCKQQLKWARGVFEVTFVELPRLFRKLTFWQRLSYATIGTYYFVGAVQFFFTLIPFIFFATGALPARMPFDQFLIYGGVVFLFGSTIYRFIQNWMCDSKTERGWHWRGMILKFACWPVFFLGFLLAVVNAEIPYIPTAKKAVTGSLTPFARPLIIHVVLFLVVIVAVFLYRRFYLPESEILLSAERYWAMLGFATIAFIMSVGGIAAAWGAMTLTPEEPWKEVDLSMIGVNSETLRNTRITKENIIV